jgi:putative membrane protein
VLKVEEGLLRRWLRFATLRADTASGGSDDEERKTGRDVLLPIVRRDELPALLPQLLPGFDGETVPWQRVSRRAVRRGFVKGAVTLLFLTGLLFAGEALLRGPRWLDLWPLLLLPLVYWLNVISYRHLGYAADRLYFQTRRGWLGRAWHIVPLRNAQTVVLRETPFDRRHGVATLHLDTAGQTHTGGAPLIANLPRGEALTLARALAHIAATTRYRWR